MEWYHAHRIGHLVGGLRANSPDQAKQIHIIPFISEPLVLNINAYNELISCIHKAGLKIYGMEIVDSPMQVDGLYPPEWRPFHGRVMDSIDWLVDSASTTWSQIANAAFKKDDVVLFGICKKIKFQIEACSCELLRLSNAYNQELFGICEQKKFKDGQRFETLNTTFIYVAMHAFLSAMGSLRDYIAEYAASYLLKEILKGESFRLMASLRKALKNCDCQNHPVAKIILDATDQENNGWLAKISSYRDLIVHYTPIEAAERRGFLIQKAIQANGVTLPTIFFPMPNNPEELKVKHTKKELHKNVNDYIQASSGFQSDENQIDALAYAHQSFGDLVYMSMIFADLSPCPPEPIHLNESNLRGPIIKEIYKGKTERD